MASRTARALGAVLGILLLLQVAAAPAVAGGDSSTVFKGLWLSTDSDGSTQLLSVSSGSEPSVTYQDWYGSVCPGPVKRWIAEGQGTISGANLTVDFGKSGCGNFGKGGYTEVYTYDAATGTLSDTYGIVWISVP